MAPAAQGGGGACCTGHGPRPVSASLGGQAAGARAPPRMLILAAGGVPLSMLCTSLADPWRGFGAGAALESGSPVGAGRLAALLPLSQCAPWRQKIMLMKPSEPGPCRLYVSSQERHVRALLEAALAQHTAALEALQRAQRESVEAEASGPGAVWCGCGWLRVGWVVGAVGWGGGGWGRRGGAGMPAWQLAAGRRAKQNRTRRFCRIPTAKAGPLLPPTGAVGLWLTLATLTCPWCERRPRRLPWPAWAS